MSRFEMAYAGSLALALGMLALAFVRPAWARGVSVLVFFIAFMVNARVAVLNPASYTRLGQLAVWRVYRESFYRWSEHAREVLLAIAVGQLVVALLLMGPRRAQLFGVIGATIFLLAISPLGRVSAFPSPLIWIVVMWVTWTRLPRQPAEVQISDSASRLT